MGNDKPLTYFLHVKPIKILLALRTGPKYVARIAKEVDITYSHAIKLLDIFNELGLVEFEEKGRIKMVKLTLSGEEIARVCDNLVSKLSKLKKP
jgi:DNA-binding MarR family transcriptional regulator